MKCMHVIHYSTHLSLYGDITHFVDQWFIHRELLQHTTCCFIAVEIHLHHIPMAFGNQSEHILLSLR